MALDPNRYAYIIPWQTQFLNKDGHPLSAGFVEIFVNNTTGTQYISYQNWLGDQNPFRIPLDSLGKCTAIGDKELHYDVYVYNYLGNLEFSRINIVTTNQYGGEIIHDNTLTGDGTNESPLSATPVINGLVRVIEPGDNKVHATVVATDPNDGTKTYAISVDDPDLSDYVKFTDLATVATSGSYTDLSNKPNLATVAITGSYNDLYDKPTLPGQVQANWTENDIAASSYIQNKPNLATVATSGSYTDLANKPNVVVFVSTSDSYDTVNNYRLAGYDVILRVYPTEGSTLHQDFRLFQYNPDGSMEFNCIRSGSGYIISYRYVLSSAGVWSRNDTSVANYEGIRIDGIGRNLHLNQNRVVQTNIPGGLFSAPASPGNNFVRLAGSSFAGNYMLACHRSTAEAYEIAIAYTGTGTSSHYTFIGTETVIANNNTVTVNQAVYNNLYCYYTPVLRFGEGAATIFEPSQHKAIIYKGMAEIGPTSDTTIAIWKDENGGVHISFASIEVGKVGSTN